VVFHQATKFENTAQPNFNHSSPPDAHVTSTKRQSVLNNTINRRQSIVVGQCPFSGHKIEVESSAT